jgi:hypothetical protein
MKFKDERLEKAYEWIDKFIPQPLTENEVIDLLIYSFGPERKVSDLNILAGKATYSKQRLLDIKPSELHQRTPFNVGAGK